MLLARRPAFHGESARVCVLELNRRPGGWAQISHLPTPLRGSRIFVCRSDLPAHPSFWSRVPAVNPLVTVPLSITRIGAGGQWLRVARSGAGGRSWKGRQRAQRVCPQSVRCKRLLPGRCFSVSLICPNRSSSTWPACVNSPGPPGLAHAPPGLHGPCCAKEAAPARRRHPRETLVLSLRSGVRHAVRPAAPRCSGGPAL